MEPGALFFIALILLGFGAFSRKAEHSPVTGPMVFVAAGLAVSPLGLDLLELEIDHVLIHMLAELTLVVILFTDASRIDIDCLRREGSLPLRLPPHSLSFSRHCWSPLHPMLPIALWRLLASMRASR